jgi:hypothetical protein
LRREDDLNLYAYTGNDPLNGTDPSGRIECTSNGNGETCTSDGSIVDNAHLVLHTIARYVWNAFANAVNSMSSSSSSGDSDSEVSVSTGEGNDQGANGTDTQASGDEKPSLIDDDRSKHILDGDKTGGGHRAGTGNPGKSEFPSSWSDDKIKGEVSDVATDPSSSRAPGRGGREIVSGTRDGIDIEVVVDPNGRIITAYPTNVPRNPR